MAIMSAIIESFAPTSSPVLCTAGAYQAATVPNRCQTVAQSLNVDRMTPAKLNTAEIPEYRRAFRKTSKATKPVYQRWILIDTNGSMETLLAATGRTPNLVRYDLRQGRFKHHSLRMRQHKLTINQSQCCVSIARLEIQTKKSLFTQLYTISKLTLTVPVLYLLNYSIHHHDIL